MIEGFERAGVGRPLVLVGDAPYAREYIESLKRRAGPNVRFTGTIYGTGYRGLQSHALAYIHATEVGGTHPALVEALGVGNCVLVHDVAENRETAGETARYFSVRDPDSLAALIRDVTKNPAEARELGERARTRARERFSWDRITDQYEDLLMNAPVWARRAP